MPEFFKAAKVADIPDPGKLTLEVEERLVVIIHVDGEFHCIDDVCTHDGGPLGDGILCGFELACPRHGAKFDVRTGAPLTMPATEPTVSHQVKIEGDDILVSLNSE
jgi:3-phenylpropionate/trans-cinnamate dioxygenase ferredoxin subunit